MTDTTSTARVPSSSSRTRSMLRRLGAAGFAFFFLKGIAWLVAPAILWVVRGGRRRLRRRTWTGRQPPSGWTTGPVRAYVVVSYTHHARSP
jgi:hypothetical protein